MSELISASRAWGCSGRACRTGARPPPCSPANSPMTRAHRAADPGCAARDRAAARRAPDPPRPRGRRRSRQPLRAATRGLRASSAPRAGTARSWMRCAPRWRIRSGTSPRRVSTIRCTTPPRATGASRRLHAALDGAVGVRRELRRGLLEAMAQLAPSGADVLLVALRRRLSTAAACPSRIPMPSPWRCCCGRTGLASAARDGGAALGAGAPRTDA